MTYFKSLTKCLQVHFVSKCIYHCYSCNVAYGGFSVSYGISPSKWTNCVTFKPVLEDHDIFLIIIYLKTGS